MMVTHILAPDAFYRTRMVTCHQTGSAHRHQRHKEQFTFALCGAEVIKDEVSRAVNLTIFNPFLSKSWCPECYAKVEPFLRPPPAS